jgi:hypothetical protein
MEGALYWVLPWLFLIAKRFGKGVEQLPAVEVTQVSRCKRELEGKGEAPDQQGKTTSPRVADLAAQTV